MALTTSDGHNGSSQCTRRQWLVRSMAAVATLAGCTSVAHADDRLAGFIEYEVRSRFSLIRIRRMGNIRSLIFVRDNSQEAFQSQMSLSSPHILRFSYLQHMFASLLLQPQQRRVLIVGLGGGSMVHFLRKHTPECEVVAVEIDPKVVELAERFFLVKRSPKVQLVVDDAFDYLANDQTTYDVIYLDAFLKPSGATDQTGAPLKMRTLDFYNALQSRLTDGGSVIFNINPHPDMHVDIETIIEAFPQSYVFRLPRAEGFVVVGSLQTERLSPEALRTAGRTLDRRLKPGFSLEAIASNLVAKSDASNPR